MIENIELPKQSYLFFLEWLGDSFGNRSCLTTPQYVVERAKQHEVTVRAIRAEGRRPYP